MAVLPIELRNKLERTIIEARDVAEVGAKSALEAIAVHHYEPYGHMSPEDRRLRNHLRARARQLGDKQNRKGELEIARLVRECAYEHWHRMLFARFLAENDLLIEPEMGVAISLEECEELAKEDGKDLWTLASEFAQPMLPQIFRPNDPVLKVFLAREHRIKLENLLNDLEPAIFTVSDSLGWVYQFWQSKRKKEVNQSGNKIGADELAAVTQLFTEPYMVSFLLDNSLGAWWAGKRMKDEGGRLKEEWKKCQAEDDCRRFLALPGVPLEYLRLVKVEEASSLCESSGKMPLLQYKEIGYFHKDEPVANLTGDLPHWRQEDVTYFVTFRAADSLPQEKLKQWQLEKEQWLRKYPQPHDEKTKREFYEKFPERLQHLLDQGYGECVLTNDNCRKIVEDSLRYFDGQRYDLDEFVVMANHVHVLVTPKAGHELSKILHSWKSFTANEINKQTGRSGPFWQKESFDHIVRSLEQVEKIRRYIKDHVSRGFQPLENQRQDAAATIWTPAAGTFDGWPEKLSELKVLDPCCGSGHFLVVAFLMLVAMRIEMEGLSAREAVDAVLRENLHGLEIDNRCVELAAFSLALTAWRYPDAGGYRSLPELNVACSGLSVSATKEEWKHLALGKQNLRIALDWMHDTFKDAPVLGSLLNPAKTDAAKIVEWKELSSALDQALKREQTDEQQEAAVVAKGLAKAATLMAGKYHLIITNVPYLARGKQDERLKEFCGKHYPSAKNDLSTVFLDRCLEFCESSRGFQPLKNQRQDAAATIGTVSIVLPQNWLFLTSYKKFREKLLKNDTWHMIARLGPRAFETISGEVVKAILISLSRGNAARQNDEMFSVSKDSRLIRGVDVSKNRTAAEKADVLMIAEIKNVEQMKQLENPSCAIELDDLSEIVRVGDHAFVRGGITTGDSPRFRRFFWEQENNSHRLSFQQSSVKTAGDFSGRELCMIWENGQGELAWAAEHAGATIAGREAWNRNGIAITYTGNLRCALYTGELFENVICVLLPRNEEELSTLWAFCSSSDFGQSARSVNQKLSVDVRYFEKAPFDIGHWAKVAEEKYPNGLPKPYSDDPTQWIFHGHPFGSVAWDGRAKLTACGPLRSDDAVLQVAVARLLGYRWPAELDAEMELSDEQREWVNKCDGLLKCADEDGIVCMPSVRGEETADFRLRALLATAFGPDWSPSVEQELIKVTGANASNLKEWLHDHFFEQHCKLFHHRPFIWHIWDGRRRDGFHALVNYHKLAEGKGKGRQLLENLTYSYLGEWITRQKEGIKRGEGGAEDRLAAALELQKGLIAIIEGEPPFDIFVRWKPIEEQPIGWEPDINDGVRLNIRPFMAQDIPGGRKGAGILRWRPNINWGKDRGKETFRPNEQYPWFWKDGEFTGDRVNDIHLTINDKQKARKEKKQT